LGGLQLQRLPARVLLLQLELWNLRLERRLLLAGLV
jgi:hypothetical protein